MFIFDRCCRCSAAVTPVKYECDANNRTGTFARSKILLTEKLTNGALVTPTPGNTQRNKHVIITSKHRFDAIITCLLRCLFARHSLAADTLLVAGIVFYRSGVGVTKPIFTVVLFS